MREHILFVSELYYPEDTSTGYYITKLAEGLANYIDVSVICSNPTYISSNVNVSSYEVKNNVKIHRVNLYKKINRSSFFKRTINSLFMSFALIFKCLKCVNEDTHVVVVTNPPLLSFFIFILSKFIKFKYTILIHDVYPDVLVKVGVLKITSIFYKTFNFLQIMCYKNARQIIVIGRDMKELIQRKIKYLYPDKVHYIPNWADLSDINSTLDNGNNKLLDRYNLTNKYIILYSGNMGKTHDLKVILDAANLLKIDCPDVHFLICGSGQRYSEVEINILNLKLNNVTLIDRVERSELNELLASANLALITFISGMSGVSVPSRMYNHMASNRPLLVLADSNSEIAQVVNENGIGLVIPPGDSQTLCNSIKKCRSNLLNFKSSRIIAESKYSFETILLLYLKIFIK